MLEELKQETERSTIVEQKQIRKNLNEKITSKRIWSRETELSRKKTLVYGYFLKSRDF